MTVGSVPSVALAVVVLLLSLALYVYSVRLTVGSLRRLGPRPANIACAAALVWVAYDFLVVAGGFFLSVS